MKLVVKAVESTEEWAGACEVRRLVFQEEQGVSADLEFDGEDDSAKHFVACLDSKIVGTARLRYLPEQNAAKIERVAVLSKFRRREIGFEIMNYIMNDLQKEGIKIAKIHSQEKVKLFYQKLGFKQQGLPFDEAGIRHITMLKEIS
ncbi:MAG: GNAT family N-acetyltransferase [Gloeobacterales cyanobacterium]